MPQTTGTVERTASKQLPSGLYYSFSVDGTWYRTGKKEAPVEAGYTVRFNYDEDKWGKHVDLDSLKFKKGEAPKTSGKSGGGSGARNSNEYWEAKEQRDISTQKKISYAGVLNTSIQVLNTALDKEFFKIPGGKKATLEAYKAALFDVADELYQRVNSAPDRHEEMMAYGEEATPPKEDDMSDFTEEEAPDEGGDDDWDDAA